VVTIMPTAPLDGPVLLPNALVDQFVKAEGNEQRALLDALRLTALGWVERHTSRSLQRRPWVAMFDAFEEVMRLPCDPVRAVLALGYVDPAGVVIDGVGTWQLIGSNLYPLAGRTWPGTSRRAGAVVVRFEAGYDDLATEAPALQIAALMMVQHLFAGGALEDVPTTVGMLLDEQYRTPVMA
jgi:uncharacterized phiE125 gp8 family phage protein